jgi:hypothetical protein
LSPSGARSSSASSSSASSACNNIRAYTLSKQQSKNPTPEKMDCCERLTKSNQRLKIPKIHWEGKSHGN